MSLLHFIVSFHRHIYNYVYIHKYKHASIVCVWWTHLSDESSFWQIWSDFLCSQWLSQIFKLIPSCIFIKLKNLLTLKFICMLIWSHNAKMLNMETYSLDLHHHENAIQIPSYNNNNIFISRVTEDSVSLQNQLFHLCCSFYCGLIKLDNKMIFQCVVRDLVSLPILLSETLRMK